MGYMNILRSYIRAALLTEMGQLEKGYLSVTQILDMLNSSTLLLFDTETTGFDPRKEHIMVTQVAGTSVDGASGEVLDKFSARAAITPAVLQRMAHEEERVAKGEWKPGRMTTREILAMTAHDVNPEAEGYESEQKILTDFSAFVEKQKALGKPLTLVAHNVNFDMHQVNAGLESYGLPKISTKTTKVFDTLVFMNKYVKPALEQLKDSEEKTSMMAALKPKGRFSPSLGNIGKAYGVSTSGSHEASHDTDQLQGVLQALRKFISEHPPKAGSIASTRRRSRK